MFKVALTGNYYSGQNEVSKIFEEFNVNVFDANTITKFLINFSPNHIKRIKEYFGDKVYHCGLLNLNRFQSNDKFNELLDLIEMDLLKSYEKFRLRHSKDFYTIFCYDFIYERNLDKYFDFKISCHRPREYRKSDMKFLTNFTFDEIERILNSEMPDKNIKSDHIIQNYNFGTNNLEDIVIGLERQIKGVHKRIMNKRNIEIISDCYPFETIT